jgi:hypothetical protein
MEKQKPDTVKHHNGITLSVNNAGIVIMQSFYEMLFQRLGLVNNNEFVSAISRQKAMHCLQYLATGQKETEEHFLLLNKVLCGIALRDPVDTSSDISPSDIDVMESLISAMVNYWPSIGQTSIDGFRGNWLVRDGILTEKEDKWELVVEKRAYDILLEKSPFSFSIIKYPWMDKPLYVTWPC